MLKEIFLLIAGAISGAAAMYLIARNSPQHFLKTKKFVDTAYSWGQNKFTALKNQMK